MTLIDALEDNGSYSPSKITDSEEVFTSSKLENLVNSILEDTRLTVPQDQVSSVVIERFESVKEDIKSSIKTITDRYISRLEMAGNSVSESTLLTQSYISSVKSAVVEGLKGSVPDSDSLASMITESLEDKIGTEITKEVETDDYSTRLIDERTLPSKNDQYPYETYNIEATGRTVEVEQKSKYKQTIKNNEERLESQFDSENLGSISNTWEGVGDQFKTNYSGENIANELAKPFVDFTTSFVLEVLEEPTKAITRSDTFNVISNPFAVVSGMVSEVTNGILDSFKNTYHDTLNTIIDSTDDVYNAAKEWLTDKINTPFSEIEGFAGKQANKLQSSVLGLRDKTLKIIKPDVMQLDNRGRLRGVFNPAIIPVDGLPEAQLSAKDSERIISQKASTNIGVSAVRRSDFVVNSGGLYMSNDAYWDIKIMPNKYNDYGPPDINEIFGCESSNRLPILSYTFDAGGLSNSQFEIYPGVQFSIPTSYSRPSTLSFAILNLVKTGQNQSSCFDEFRDSYIRWVLGNVESNLDQLPACLDYHYCSYAINIVKYSPQWFPLRRWDLLGIPQITIYEQGNSSSAQEVQNLNFSIVGTMTAAKPVLSKKNNKSGDKNPGISYVY